jgi:large subunit ribosomal protein L19
MNSKILEVVEKKYYKKRPDVKVGDTVELHLKIKEGNKERIQVFKGVVISIKGVGLNKNLVVRKISYGVGVEKIVPFHSPVLEKIKIVKRGTVRRAKLYYMRDRVGKKAMKVAKTKEMSLEDEQEEVKVEEKEEVKEEIKKE